MLLNLSNLTKYITVYSMYFVICSRIHFKSKLPSPESNKHVVGLDAVISLFSSSCRIVVKHCSFSMGAVNVIVFLMLSILSVKKFIKSLL